MSEKQWTGYKVEDGQVVEIPDPKADPTVTVINAHVDLDLLEPLGPDVAHQFEVRRHKDRALGGTVERWRPGGEPDPEHGVRDYLPVSTHHWLAATTHDSKPVVLLKAVVIEEGDGRLPDWVVEMMLEDVSEQMP